MSLRENAISVALLRAAKGARNFAVEMLVRVVVRFGILEPPFLWLSRALWRNRVTQSVSREMASRFGPRLAASNQQYRMIRIDHLELIMDVTQPRSIICEVRPESSVRDVLRQAGYQSVVLETTSDCSNVMFSLPATASSC